MFTRPASLRMRATRPGIGYALPPGADPVQRLQGPRARQPSITEAATTKPRIGKAMHVSRLTSPFPRASAKFMATREAKIITACARTLCQHCEPAGSALPAWPCASDARRARSLPRVRRGGPKCDGAAWLDPFPGAGDLRRGWPCAPEGRAG